MTIIGSYLEFNVANTTSLYINLRNVRKDLSPPSEPAKVDARQLVVQSARKITPPSNAVSLLVQIHQGPTLYFNQTGHDVLAISSSLDATISHSIKLTYLGAAKARNMLEFEGIWLDNGGHLMKRHSHSATTSPLGTESRGITSGTASRKHFAVVTGLAYKDPSTAINAWPQSLASHFNTSYDVFPTANYCLTSACSISDLALSDVYFRTGPPGSPHSHLPYRFGAPLPAALILDFGLLEYQNFLGNSPSSHAINQFTTTFVQQYTSFVSAIRSTAYPYHSPYVTQQHGTLAVDASFTYNSAPSTLPIFLLTPLTPSKRLHRLLSHAVSQSVNALQAQGDKSTFWLDTSGWLTEKDFAKSSNNPKEEQSSNDQNRNPANITAVRTLTAEAHRQIAEYLADHLCPYLSTRNTPLTLTFSNTATAPLASSEELSAEAACPFSKYDNYLGNLYVPIEADISKMLEERKIELVKKFLGMEDTLH